MLLVTLAAVLGLQAAVLGLPAAAFGFAAPKQFAPTGHQQVYEVPRGVLLEGVSVVGGWGGSNQPQASPSIYAEPATVQGYLVTTPGEKLYVEVGQSGMASGGATFGGGGAAGSGTDNPTCTAKGLTCSGAVAGSGGGASDIRTCSMSAASCPGGSSSLDSRLIVAAGGGGDGAASIVTCDPNETGGGSGQNEQLPSASALGPAAIRTPKGIVIPGFASGAARSVTTVDGLTNAAMGTTAAGAGGSFTTCRSGGGVISGGVAGHKGAGPDGGPGGSASSTPCCGSGASGLGGAGGGGGGGYFGGGGGATGAQSCSPSPCQAESNGEGGAAGSSFVSKQIKYPEIRLVYGVGDVLIELVPVIEIDTPANGAVYSPGQVVDARWSCSYSSTTELGCNSPTSGTVPSGSPISTAPGTHTFTVKSTVHDSAGSHPISASVTYTVKPR